MGARPIRFLALAAVVAAIALVAGPAQATGDRYWDVQWGPRQINVEQAWAAGATGSGVVIGIVDSGVDLNHPDLAGRVSLADTADCVGAGDSGGCTPGHAEDGFGHGTHVSGIIAANTNTIGIAGMASGARLVMAKALDERGSGSITDIIKGIEWVVSRGAQVVNLSFGPDSNFLQKTLIGTPSDMLQAIDAAWARGAIPILASGNENSGINTPLTDGSNNYGNVNAIVVGATGESGQPASYSSGLGNAKWAVVAPGGAGTGSDSIISTLPGAAYGRMSGTSMAAPHVAGLAALLLGQGLGQQAVVDRILGTADGAIRCGGNCRGRVSAGAAVGGSPVSAPSSQQPAYPNQSQPQPQTQQPQPQPQPQQPEPQQPVFGLPGLQPSPQPQPQPPQQPQPTPAPAPSPSPQPAPAPPAPPPAPVFAPSPPPAPMPEPGVAPVVSPPATVLPAPITPPPPTLPPPAPTPTAPAPTTTTQPPPTTTPTAPPQVAAPRRTVAPATSKAIYGESRGGGSTAAAIAAASVLLGTAVIALALTRKPPPPDLI